MKNIYTLLYSVIISGILLILSVPLYLYAQDTAQLRNPLPEGVDTITELIQLILESIVLPIGSIVVVFFIIFTGFKFVTAQGNPEKISEARQMFVWTIVGTAVLLGSWAIVVAIEGTLCEITNNSIPGLCN